ncbi:hypothetical protein [Microbacterium sp.]|uniref:hypothetical protein n=1 Tax=Microbacterium sp. TaxID=51671 RepID=UPI0039E4821B
MTTTSPGPSPVMRATLTWSVIVVGALAVIAALVGWLVDGTNGLLSGVAGVVVSGLFLGLTALIVVIAERTPQGDPRFFVIFISGWLVKLLVFVGIMIVLRMQTWVSPYVLIFSLVAAVLASLIVDVVAFVRTRVPYVGDVPLPGPDQLDE